ncbi:MAG TPA: lysophospholipid acyltransferase family protein [Candidatus Sumerlaeota bacterium]|nr:MAG: Lipid A biosynthesis lauroyl acyltransferase [candidate division BRC1 bacterium ADurb.BinA292]HOE95738.1 lysophospholipid acyltransferase family protein [Candidatus Sumerlaeota bacterium]HOR26822.1 lysophospholipid acyltransferase family protein [Candidatus Sumerlaeota bacterium]HPK01574.1 lysophospholipid acyltransferase family protein [Candidatus Sumerlaeota bacterium]
MPRPARFKKRRLRRRLRPLTDRLLYGLVEGLRRVLARLPHALVLALGRAAGSLGYLVCGGLRRLAMRQLRETGIAPDEREARRLARATFRSLGMNALEWLHSSGWDRPRLEACVRVEGIEHIREGERAGRGIIMVAYHFGNWELLSSSFRLVIDYPALVVMTPIRNPLLNDFVVRMRQRWGFQMVTQNDVRTILRGLRAGWMLAVLADQDTRRVRGIHVDFLGRPALTPSGAAVIAWRTGAPICPYTIERTAEDPRRHILRGHPCIWPDPDAPEEQEVRRLTQAYTDVLAREIRRRPDQWVWIHDRWHHPPRRHHDALAS